MATKTPAAKTEEQSFDHAMARLEHIVTEFSRFARMPRPRAESLDVAEVAVVLERDRVVLFCGP